MRALAFEIAEGQVDEEKRRAFEQHIESCVACRSAAGWAIHAVRTAEQLGNVPFSPSAEERILDRLKPVIQREAQRLERRRSRWTLTGPLTWAVAGAMASLVAVVIWQRVSRAPHAIDAPIVVATLEARVLRRHGDVQLMDSRGVSTPHGAQLALRTGDIIDTPRGASMDVQIGRDVIRVTGETRLQLSTLTPGLTTLGLNRGTLLVDAAEHAPERQLEVRTPFGSVSVIGTQFRVSTDAGGEVATLRGTVKVAVGEADSTLREVHAGELLRVRDGTIRPLDPEEAALLRTQLDDLSSHEARLAEGGEPRVSRMPATPKPRVDTKALATSTRRDLVRATRDADCTQAMRVAEKSGRVGSHAQAEALSLVGQCFQTQRQYRDALDTYRRIVDRFGGTPTAEGAWFEIGRIAEKLDDIATARTAYAKYRQEYPRGVLAGDALYGLCRMDLQAERYDAARSCLRQYRKTYRHGERAADTLYLEAVLEKEARGDCAAALTLLGAYLKTADPKKVEDAMYARAVCLRGGARDELQRAVQAYLARFPTGPHAKEMRAWLVP